MDKVGYFFYYIEVKHIPQSKKVTWRCIMRCRPAASILPHVGLIGLSLLQK